MLCPYDVRRGEFSFTSCYVRTKWNDVMNDVCKSAHSSELLSMFFSIENVSELRASTKSGLKLGRVYKISMDLVNGLESQRRSKRSRTFMRKLVVLCSYITLCA